MTTMIIKQRMVHRKTEKNYNQVMKLKLGKKYTFRVADISVNSDHRKKEIKKEKKKLIGIYPNFALFEGKTGIKVSYRFPEVYQILSGKIVEN